MGFIYISTVVEETNRYTEQLTVCGHALAHSLTARSWKPVTAINSCYVEDLYAYGHFTGIYFEIIFEYRRVISRLGF
jgi:hypothetical protein